MKKFIYGAMSFGLLFTACSSDTLTELTGGENTGVDRTYYVNVTIHGGEQGTRSGLSDGNPDSGTDFVDGTSSESEITSAYFVFYDADGNTVGEPVVAPIVNETDGPENETVETNYKSIVSFAVPKDITPDSVVCYLNPSSTQGLVVPLSKIQTVTRTASVNTDGTFPMSNSVFYPNTGDTEPQIAVSVSGKLYDTYEEAAAEGAQMVDVYVERYASKLAFDGTKVKIGEATNENNPAYETYTYVYNRDADGTITHIPVSLQFVPDRWALNAEAKNTYVVKSFREENPADGSFLPNNYSYNDLNTVINQNNLNQSIDWVWNNADYHRSYWGMSPAYFTTNYPVVASDVEQKVKDGTLQQKYYTYSDLFSKGVGFDGDDTGAHYFNPTTVGSAALNSVNPAAAVASVIFVGHYDLKVNETSVPTGTTFYTYLRTGDSYSTPIVYFKNSDGTADSEVSGGESMLFRFYNALTVLYRKVTTTTGEGDDAEPTVSYQRLDPYNEDDLATLNSLLEVAKPSDDALEIASRYRTLQFKSDLETSDLNGIYIIKNNTYNSIEVGVETPSAGAVTLVDANNILLNQVNYCSEYNLGHAYFNIPVKHYGWYRTGNRNNTEIDDPANPGTKILPQLDWSYVNVGDFGMVRNHSYKIVVDAISGLGTGIGGDDEYIVPPADTKDYYVSYRINILRWAVVPTQTVTLQ